MAEAPRTSIRLGIVLALAVVGLFEVLSLLQGVRSVRRLRARVSHEAGQRVEAARGELEAALAPGGAPSWDKAAALALARGLATEVEVIGPGGRVIQEIQAETGAHISIDEVDGRGVVARRAHHDGG